MSKKNESVNLKKLPNLGAELVERICSIGIETPSQLDNMDTMEIVKTLIKNGEDVCVNMLYAIEGAKRRVRWHSLPEEIKDRLKNEYKNIHSEMK